MTKLIKAADPNLFNELKSCLYQGGLIIYPTETLYGLGCLASNEAACERIVDIKGRDKTKGLIVLIKDIEMMSANFELSEKYLSRYAKIDKPLTLILKSKIQLPKVVNGGTDKTAVRISSSDFVKQLFTLIDEPITSTSANISGGANLLSFQEIYDQFVNKVDLIVDSGNIPPSKGSAILDLTVSPPEIIRKGDLTFNDIEEFISG